jgi:isocitrate dehydrogenase (NAD+)
MPQSNFRTVTLIKGDGIGPEIADAVKEIFAAAEVPITWEDAEAGLGHIERGGNGLPPETMASIVRNKVALKGPTTTPIGGGHKSVNVTIRKALDLFANVRPCKSLPGVHTRFDNVDLIIVRENVEDTYGGIEHMQSPDVAQCLKLITRPGSLNIARYAFEMARREGRKRVTCVQKANIMKITDGLFLDCFRQVAAEFPDIVADEILIDNCCMQLVVNPSKFDVLLTPNLFGDILSDLCAGLVGGLGVAPGGNIGAGKAVFEAVHGSAPDIAGKGLANPTALLLSGIQMLRYMGLLAHADRVEQGMRLALVEGVRTRDLGGSASTREFAKGIISQLPPLARDLTKHDSHAAGATTAPASLGGGGGASARPATIGGTTAAQTGGLPPAPRFAETGAVEALQEAWTLTGVDVFIRHHGLPKLPAQAGPFKPTLISNRGTKVWPGEPLDITLVNVHRCRFTSASPATNRDVLQLLDTLEKQGLEWMHIEKLHEAKGPDGKPVARYTKAQGE